MTPELQALHPRQRKYAAALLTNDIEWPSPLEAAVIRSLGRFAERHMSFAYWCRANRYGKRGEDHDCYLDPVRKRGELADAMAARAAVVRMVRHAV